MAKSAVSDSAMPWPTHSSAGLPVRLAKVSTATVRPAGAGRGRGVVMPKPTGGIIIPGRKVMRPSVLRSRDQPFARVVQIDVELTGRLVTERRILGQRLAHHRLDVGGHRVVEARQRVGLVVEDAVGRVGQRLGLERRPPGQHLVEHGADGEEIGAMVDRRRRAAARGPCS